MMGLFSDIFQPRKNKDAKKAITEADGFFKTLTAYRPVFTTWNGMLYESELVRSAIDARARHVSKLKIEIQGTAQPTLRRKLNLGMNQWQTNSQFLYRLSTILDIHNTAIITPVFDEYMAVSGYYPVLPEKCSIIEYKGEPWLRYRFINGQVAAAKMDECAIMTRHQYRSDFFGDPNTALEETMKLIHVQNQGIEEAVKNSATFRFMAQVSNFTTDEDLEKERKRFTSKSMRAEAEAGGLLLFPMTYQNIKQIESNPYTVDDKQMDLIRTNVFDYYGVNMDVLQNKAYGDAWSAFYEGAVEPFAIQFSEAMTKAIFTPRERAQGSSLMATSNRLQYLSNSDKLQVSSQMADRGIMSRNEIREIWNLPPVPNGDVPTIRGEYYLLNDDGTTTKKGDDLTGGENATEE